MYIVIELQTNNGKTANIVNAYAEMPDAWAKYYSILSAAAKSKVEVHAAAILTETGSLVASGHFAHAKESEE